MGTTTAATDSIRCGGARPTQHATNPGFQFLGTERLDHVIVGAQLQTGDAISHVAKGGEQDDRHLRLGSNALGDRKAIELGHHHVEHHQVGLKATEQLHRLCTIHRRSHLVSLHAQTGFEDATNILLIISHQDAQRLGTGF